MTGRIDARLDIGYFSARAGRLNLRVQAILNDRGLTLLAPNDVNGKLILWHGERRGQGHYALTGGKPGARGSLHRFADGTILEGFWSYARENGFWRLHLPVDSNVAKKSRVVIFPVGRVARKSTTKRKRVKRAA